MAIRASCRAKKKLWPHMEKMPCCHDISNRLHHISTFFLNLSGHLWQNCRSRLVDQGQGRRDQYAGAFSLSVFSSGITWERWAGGVARLRMGPKQQIEARLGVGKSTPRPADHLGNLYGILGVGLIYPSPRDSSGCQGQTGGCWAII